MTCSAQLYLAKMLFLADTDRTFWRNDQHSLAEPGTLERIPPLTPEGMETSPDGTEDASSSLVRRFIQYVFTPGAKRVGQEPA